MQSAIITDIKYLADDLRIFRLKTEFKPNFIAGQFITLGLQDENENMIFRAYTIASSPLENELEFIIVLKQDGKLTPLLYSLSLGDSVFIGDKIVGHFNPMKNLDKNKIFIATGTGIAPFVSVLRTYKDFNKKICLINGGRFINNLAYMEEMKKLENNNKKFAYFPITSREELNGIKGHIDSIFNLLEYQKFTSNFTPKNTEIFICGAIAMVHDQIDYWTKLGFTENSPKNPDGNLFVEKY